jgi:beta,beta-carotene 9',10'-dioxygenase
LPNWLQGSLIRNGPAKWDLEPGFCLNHFFDGCALLTKFDFRSVANGDQVEPVVAVSTRYLRSDAYKKMEAVRRPVFTEFGTKAFPDTTRSVWSRLVNKLVPSDLTDNDFANVYQVHGELYVSTESCNIWKLDPNDMRALHKASYDSN